MAFGECYLVGVLVAGFALLVVVSGVGLWRAVARNQSAARYLQETSLEEGESWTKAQMSPEKWALVGPMQNLRLILRSEIDALSFGNNTVLQACMNVNTEVSGWLALCDQAQLAGPDAKVVDAVQLQIRSVWQEGSWGSQGALQATRLLEQLRLIERSLLHAASQVAAGQSPYR